MPRDLESQIQDLLEGRLQGEDLDQLQDILRDDPDARRTYRDYLYLHHALQFRSKGVDLLNVIPMEVVNQRRQRRAFQRAGIAAVALLLIGAIALTLIMVRSPEPTLTFRTSPGSLFSLSHSIAGEKAPDGLVLEPGSRLVLTEGTIELQFESGVRGIIRGPADLTLQRSDLLDMQNGVAWFHVPPEAVGFQVTTPDLILKDLGTEFGVVSESNFLDEVHVFKGKVEVLNRSGLKKQEILEAGQARFAGSGGRWKEISLRTDYFLDELPDKEVEQEVIVVRKHGKQLIFRNDASDSDLLQGVKVNASNWILKTGATPENLNDGIHGESYDEIGKNAVASIAWPEVGGTAEFYLGRGIAGKGYDISSIQSIADWNSAGFGNQAWTVEVKPVGRAYQLLHTVNYHPLTSEPLDGGGATKVLLKHKSGFLARGIEAIRFTAGHVASSVNNTFVWREIDVFGEEVK